MTTISTEQTAERKQIADTIFRQLGGGRFATMTGSKNFSFNSSAVNPDLTFRIGSGSKWMACKIEVTPLDVYTMTFFNLRKGVITKSEVHDMVYCDQLEDVFEKATGLYTSF